MLPRDVAVFQLVAAGGHRRDLRFGPAFRPVVAVVFGDLLIQHGQIVGVADGALGVGVARVDEQRRVEDAGIVGIQLLQRLRGVQVGLRALGLGFLGALSRCAGVGGVGRHVLLGVGGIDGGAHRQAAVLGRSQVGVPAVAVGGQRRFGDGVGQLHAAAAALGEHQVQPAHAAQPRPGGQHRQRAVAVFVRAAVDDGRHAEAGERIFQCGDVDARRGHTQDDVRPLGLQGCDLFAGGLGRVVGDGRRFVDEGDGLRHGVGVGQGKETDLVPGTLQNAVHAVGDAVAVPAGGAVEDGRAVGVAQVGGQRVARAHVGVAAQPLNTVGKVLRAEGVEVVPGGRERAEHIHAAGQAGAARTVQAAAGVQQDGIRRGALERRHIGQVDAAGVAQAFQPAGGEHRHRDIAHAHQAGNALGAVGQRGGDGALALVGAGAHDAVAVDGGDVLIAGAPVDGLAALFLRRLVGQQRHAGVFGVQVQFQLAGIVDEGRVGRFALAAGQPGDGEGPHDKVDVHRLALHAVVRAGGGVAALPHIIGAGVAQFVGKPRDPEVVAPGVERRVAETGAHPVQRGVDALLAGIAVLGQAVKERLGDGGHLLGEDIADARVLEVVVDGVRELVGRGGVVPEPLLRG